MYVLASGVTGPPGAQRVPLRPYVRFARERREPSRGVDGLIEVIPDDAERLPKSPGVEYPLPNGVVFES
jgi:hypothetical protein